MIKTLSDSEKKSKTAYLEEILLNKITILKSIKIIGCNKKNCL